MLLEANKKLDLAAVASIPVIMTLANSMLIPVLPLMEKKLRISATQASLIITIYAAVAILFIPFAGYLSDRYGRKKIIIPSLIIAAAGGLISGLAAWFMKSDAAFWIIMLGRFIQGIGAAGSFPIVLPLVGDMFRSEKDVSSGLGIVETSNTFGKVLSPILGSALAAIAWFLPLIIIPFVCLISIISVAIFVKKPENDSGEKLSLRQFTGTIKEILVRHGRWLYAIFAIGGIIMFVLFGFLYYLSSFLEDKHGIHGIWKGLLLAVPLFSVCLSSFITGKVIGDRKKRMKWVSVAGLILLTLPMLYQGFANPENLYVIMALMFISGTGIGITLPCLDALITNGIEKKQRGTITSLYSSMRFVGVAAGPPATALLMDNESVLFYLLAALSAVLCFIALLAIKPDRAA